MTFGPDRFTLTYAQQSTTAPSKKSDSEHRAENKKANDSKAANKSEPKSAEHTVTVAESDGRNCHLGASSFFNIREANPDVAKNEWEFETTFAWKTNSDGSDDDVGPAVALYYGLDDDAFIELEVMYLNLGDGGDQGNGDLELTYFRRHICEGDVMPAFATRWSLRIPSGEGSSGVDGEAHFILTKTLAPNFRAHLDGFIESANGGRGDEDIDRRYFQWGVGPGFDYSLSESTLLLMNYLHRCSEFEGNHNLNILQFGVVQALGENMALKAAFDVGLDGAEETPNFGAKLLWSIEF
ncbi:MAG: hypothetical protein JNG88_00655 [Phycisphaerales bacterium]|nr:hypothetical protein [Phycisphaerales bacterium]